MRKKGFGGIISEREQKALAKKIKNKTNAFSRKVMKKV